MENILLRTIKRVSVEGLFGLYDYSLSIQKSDNVDSKIMILYGDNGSGKTTILRLLFNLLAPDTDRGHKSYVASIPFKRCEIELSDKTLIIAERSGKIIIGSFKMMIKYPRKKEISVFYHSDEHLSIKAASTEQNYVYNEFLKQLGELNTELYLLSDNRDIKLAGLNQRHIDLFSSIGLENEFEIFESRSVRSINRRDEFISPEVIAIRLLYRSIDGVETWIRRQAIEGSSIGESNVDAIYKGIIQELMRSTDNPQGDCIVDKNSLKERMLKLERRSKEFATYNFMPEFKANIILDSINTSNKEQFKLISKVLNPYLESREKKLEALNNTYTFVNQLVTVLNSFLTNKVLVYNLSKGFRIIAENNELSPSMLSSGERHLLLLFFNSLIAVDYPSIVLVDEPEISLNIKWQRELLSSLLDCIGDNPVQYIFATHSLELISTHSNSVVKLINSRTN